MPNTYTKIYIQVVFWTRDNIIHKSFQDELYAYIGGTLKSKGHKPLSIGGTSNHIHIFLGLNPDQAISEMVKIIKVASNRFIKDRKFLNCKFNWQVGFGGFSYSHSHISQVCRYIENQEKHHKKKTFREEYIEMLKAFEIEYDEKYIL
jgi:putative transposase